MKWRLGDISAFIEHQLKSIALDKNAARYDCSLGLLVVNSLRSPRRTKKKFERATDTLYQV